MERYVFIFVLGIAIMAIGGFVPVLMPTIEGLANSVGSLGRAG